MNKYYKSLLYFHQGFTDIVNCLPLIHYYSHYKSNLDVIVRIDARDFIEYTCRGLKNVSFIYLDKLILDNTVDFSKIIPEYEEYEITNPCTPSLAFLGSMRKPFYHERGQKHLVCKRW